MANTNGFRQSKLRKLMIAGETTPGTYIPADANTAVIPVMGTIVPALDRGTGMISRASTQDGYAGSLASIRGSTGWSLATEMEIHNFGTKYDYWVLALLACGFRGVEQADTPAAGDTTFRLTPTTRDFDSFSGVATDSDPVAVSLTVANNNNEVDDWAQRLRGCTGVPTFDFTAGEIAKFAVAFKGQIVSQVNPNNDFLDLSDPNVSAFGTTAGFVSPFVVDSINLILTDADDVDRAVCLQSFSLNMNFNHPDAVCPSEPYGFDISPVFADDAPTFDIVFPSNATSDPWVFTQLRSGATFTISVTLNSADGKTITVTVPKGQFESAGWTDVNGANMYQLSCRAVRDPGAASNDPVIIDYLFSPA